METNTPGISDDISRLLNISAWIDIQKSITEITGMSIGLYDSLWNTIVEPPIENKFNKTIQTSAKGRDVYETFCRDTMEKALNAEAPIIVRSPTNQYLFVVTLRADIDTPLFIIGGESYLSYEDFSHFVENAHEFDLSSAMIAPLAKDVTFRDYKTLEAVARFVETTTRTVLRNVSPSKGRPIQTGYKQKALLGLITELATSTSFESMAAQVFQALCILFDVDSLGLLLKTNGCFVSAHTFGPLKGVIKDVRLKTDEPLIQDVIENKELVLIEGLYYILEAGFDEKVTSVHIFPLVNKGETTGLINIYNTQLDEDATNTLYYFTQILSFTWQYLSIQEECKKIKEGLSIFTDSHRIIGSILEEESLYKTILERSTDIIKAEQGSLMLIDSKKNELAVKAAKGINTKLAEHLKVKVGEGIAGKVYQSAEPLIVKNVEDDPRTAKKSRSRYKTKSFISLPLMINSRTIGVLNITDKISGEVFKTEDLELLQSIASYASIAIERSEYFRMTKDLRKISITDALTGLLNRRYFQERLAEEMERSKRHNTPLSIIMIDVDNFKRYNDRYGHIAGDNALKTVAMCIRDTVRAIDVVSRYGGEEFAVILPQTGKMSSRIIAERIRAEVSNAVLSCNGVKSKGLTISLGLASFPEDVDDINDLINSADRALYMAKDAGKNRVYLYVHKELPVLSRESQP